MSRKQRDESQTKFGRSTAREGGADGGIDIFVKSGPSVVGEAHTEVGYDLRRTHERVVSILEPHVGKHPIFRNPRDSIFGADPPAFNFKLPL